MLKLEYFRYVLEIAKHKSMSKAAAALYLSQPYLSAELKKLEQTIGVTLFNRSRAGMALTPAGDAFVALAEEMMALEARAHHLGDQCVAPSPRLSVASIYSFTMLELFRQFSTSRHEGAMAYAYEEMPNVDIPHLVANQERDLGLVFLLSTQSEEQLTQFHNLGLDFYPLYQEGLSLVVGGRHPLAKRSQVSLSELLPYPMIVEKLKMRNPGASWSDNILFPKLFLSNVRMPMQFDNSRSLMFYLSRDASCFWIGQRSLNLESPFYLNGDLCYIPISDANVSLTTGYLVRKDDQNNPELTAFIHHLEAYFHNVVDERPDKDPAIL